MAVEVKRAKPAGHQMLFRLTALLCAMAILFVSVSFDMLETFAAAPSITKANHAAWAAATLDEAYAAVNTFLTAQKTASAPITDASRIYKNNPNYSEASLAALQSTLDSASALPSGSTKTAKDLLRLQMIRNVRDLEDKKVFAANEPSKILLNNYPNAKDSINGKYTIEMKYQPKEYPSIEGYDIVFAMDWSDSMNHSYTVEPPASTGITQPVNPNSARPMAKNILINLSKELFADYPNSRINVMGMNVAAKNSMTTNISQVNLDENTGFVDKSQYASAIENAFRVEPTQNSDSPAMFTAVAKQAIDARTDKRRIPVIILISDFQIYYAQSKVTESDTYWKTAMPAQAAAFQQAYPEGKIIAVRADHYGNRTFMEGINLNAAADQKMNQYFITQPHWSWLKVTQNNFTTAYQDIKSMVYDTLNSGPTGFTVTDPMGSKFNYVNSSWRGTAASPVYSAASDSITFTGDAAFTSTYQITADAAGLSSAKNEEKFVTNGTTVLSSVLDGNSNFRHIPTAYLPVSQAAIELYTYEGTDAGSQQKANYSLSKVIAGENLAQYGGLGSYTDIQASLKNIPYGNTLTRDWVWNLLTTKYAASVSGYTRQDTAGFTDSSLKVTFDSGKNVFKVYAFKRSQNFTVTERFRSLGNPAKVLMADRGTTVQYGTNFNRVSGIPPKTIQEGITTHYLYGYQVDSGAVNPGEPPQTLLQNITSNHTITYLYYQNFTVTERFRSKNDTANILKADQSTVVQQGTSFSRASGIPPKTITQGNETHYLYGYQINNGAVIQGEPPQVLLQNIAASHVITYLYYQEYTVTERFRVRGDVERVLMPDQSEKVYRGDDFDSIKDDYPPPTLYLNSGGFIPYQLYGYQIDNGAVVRGRPTQVLLKNITSDHVITYLYSREFTITERFRSAEDLEYALLPNRATTVHEYDSFSSLTDPPPKLINESGSIMYHLYGYQIDNEEPVYGEIPVTLLDNITEDHVITYLYQRPRFVVKGKYHDDFAPYTKLQDDAQLALVLSGDDYLPASAFPPEVLVKDGYEYTYTGGYKFEVDDGTLLSDEVPVTDINSDVTIVFAYSKGQYLGDKVLHVRQVIIDKSGKSIEIPDKGFMTLTGTDRSMNLVSFSGVESVQGVPFSDANIQNEFGTLTLNALIPQYYSYEGYVKTTTDEPHLKSKRKSGKINLDYSSEMEYWVTVYLTPIKEPNQYQWGSATNEFGKIRLRMQ